ncbi:MAG: DUF1178 family protein [Sphingomonas sp.]
MIVFDLQCEAGHVFEAWFASSAAYEQQQERALVRCPLCGSSAVTKAVMAPNIAAKSNRVGRVPALDNGKAALVALAKAQAAVLAQSEWVGSAFVERARAMHHGDIPQAPIYGEATSVDAADLVAEGVPVAPLVLPIVPPPLRN